MAGGVYGVDGRAVIYHMAYFSPKVFGGGQFHLTNISDRETHALIRGISRPSLASNDTAVQKNSDGSTDIYFGPVAPAGKESNWVPTDPKRQFELLFRLYGPKKELFEKRWKLPDIEEVK